GRRTAFDPGNAHAVVAFLFQLDGREIGDAVGRDVVFRIAHLVHQLFGYPGDCNSPTRSRMFGDDERAVFAGFDNRVADVPELGVRLPINRAIASGGLRAAFDDVTGDCPCRDPVPIVELPAEFVDHRAQRQSRVGATAGDDDLRALFQRLGDRSGAEIDV